MKKNEKMQTYTIELPSEENGQQTPVVQRNRPKRKRISKFRFYFVNIFLGVLIIGIISAIFIYTGCRIQTVNVEGNTVYAEEDLENAILNDAYSFNSVYVYFKSILKPVENIPFIESYTVKWNSPTKITISVTEKSLLGYVMSEDGSQYVYFDDDGVVQEVSTLYVDSVMQIGGISVSEPVAGEELEIEEDQLKALLSLIKNLKKNEITANAIYFDESGDLFITYGDSIQINFGSSDYMAEKVIRLTYILPKLEGMSGTLHLEDWNEENTDIVFSQSQE